MWLCGFTDTEKDNGRLITRNGINDDTPAIVRVLGTRAWYGGDGGADGAQFDGRGVEERYAPSGQGEASDLPFHEWRAIAPGFVGLQAEDA